MRNIIRIFTSDAKRLATNVIAVVVIMGLSVIPSLYAWFNILSNWDPYGEAATSNLNVVVASCDEGITFEGVEVNIGNMVVSNLKQNKTIGWVFADSEQEAIQGVYSGDYYAALVIDETFSADMISFLGGDPKNPKITYYENEKKNAIAPKITGKVKTTVQEEINSTFVSTIAETIMEASEYIVASDDKGNLSTSMKNKLESLQNDLNTYITIMDSYIGIMDSAGSLMATTKEVTNQMDAMMEAGRTLANSADVAADTTTETMHTVSDVVVKEITNMEYQLDTMAKKLSALASDISSSSISVHDQIGGLKIATSALKQTFDATMKQVNTSTPAIKEQINTVDADFDKIMADLDVLDSASQVANEDTKEIFKKLEEDIAICTRSLDQLEKEYTEVVQPQLDTTMRSIQDSVSEVQEILNYSSESINDVAVALGSYPDMLALGRDNLAASRDEAVEMENRLKKIVSDMQNLEQNEQYTMLVELIKSDPKLIADFISNPVKLKQEPIYAMENNGSATAPFYFVLSIWFGSLILVAIIHTELKNNPGCKNLRNSQKFFGRYIVFYLIGQLQVLITTLGCLLYVGMQCEHPFLLWLAASFTSFTFTLFMYSLGYAFGNVGEAAAVVLMVIQVAGSGGTFPVEVLPKVFQYLYQYMPFAHGMNAMRETIAGMHGYDYWRYLGGMTAYILVALFFGLVLSVPCKKLNKKIEESKEKTDLLL